MSKISKALKLATEEFKKEYGPDAKLQEGDAIATVFNDGTLIITVENSKLKAQIILGEPYIVDFNMGS